MIEDEGKNPSYSDFEWITVFTGELVFPAVTLLY